MSMTGQGGPLPVLEVSGHGHSNRLGSFLSRGHFIGYGNLNRGHSNVEYLINYFRSKRCTVGCL